MKEQILLYPELFEYYPSTGITSNNPTRNFCNMISRGIKQSERILIDHCGINKRWAQRYLLTRVLTGDRITEVWVLENSGKLTKLF